MEKITDWLRDTPLVDIAFRIGLAIWILVSFVRCSFEG